MIESGFPSFGLWDLGGFETNSASVTLSPPLFLFLSLPQSLSRGVRIRVVGVISLEGGRRGEEVVGTNDGESENVETWAAGERRRRRKEKEERREKKGVALEMPVSGFDRVLEK